jgi:hypothetical protein
MTTRRCVETRSRLGRCVAGRELAMDGVDARVQRTEVHASQGRGDLTGNPARGPQRSD